MVDDSPHLRIPQSSKVQIHCYETTDLDGLSRVSPPLLLLLENVNAQRLQISNEFKFPIATFHHAHETYLVPNVLRNTYGDDNGCLLPWCC